MQIPALDIYGWIYNTKNSKVKGIRISFLGSSLIQLKFMQIPALDIYGWIYNTKNSKVKG
jgi:acylphosphatase